MENFPPVFPICFNCGENILSERLYFNEDGKPIHKRCEEKKMNTGWECPRCGKVHAPVVKFCDCIRTETTEKDSKQLLNE